MAGTAELGGGGRGGMQLQLKFDDQITGNRVFKVPVFKISRGQSVRISLDGLHLWLSTMAPHFKLRSTVPALCDEYHLIF